MVIRNSRYQTHWQK